jgi:hypothetical protein
MVRLLARVIGIGIETADMLVREILSRNLSSTLLKIDPAQRCSWVGLMRDFEPGGTSLA